jgi:hypothetical protein
MGMCVYTVYNVFSTFFFIYGDMGVIWASIVDANGHTCTFLGEMGYFEFLILFCIYVDVMRVYVDADFIGNLSDVY